MFGKMGVFEMCFASPSDSLPDVTDMKHYKACIGSSSQRLILGLLQKTVNVDPLYLKTSQRHMFMDDNVGPMLDVSI